MLLYNITVILETDIETQWTQWAKNEFIVAAMATNLFASSRLLKVLDSPNEGVTYCIQFVSASYESYREYLNSHHAGLIKQQTQKFANKHVVFSSLMEYIDHQ